jgi:hypothetical protein
MTKKVVVPTSKGMPDEVRAPALCFVIDNWHPPSVKSTTDAHSVLPRPDNIG